MTSFILKDENDTEVANISVNNVRVSAEENRKVLNITLNDGTATLSTFIGQLSLVSSFIVDGASVATGILHSINVSSFDENEVTIDSFQFSIENS